jgi:hypothetical protein
MQRSEVRFRFVASVVLAAAALAVASALGAGTAGAEPVDGESGSITVEQTPAPGGELCLPFPLGVSHLVADTPESFALVIDVAFPLCPPVEAHAVVYAMPGGGVAWPQVLAEKVTFTLASPGRTVVTFAKGCDPVQFDVVTGATPDVIAPDGAWHGPLLFPFDLGTSLQWFGGGPGCGTTTTTTSTTTTTTSTTSTTTTTTEPTTTTTEPSTTSTSEPQVQGTTTVAPSDTAGLGAPVSVEAATLNPVDAPPAAALALTGGRPGPLLVPGIGFLLSGLALSLLARRRALTATTTPARTGPDAD